jgi:septal ring factor EnvC (AmiA/AmiB activator)
MGIRDEPRGHYSRELSRLRARVASGEDKNTQLESELKTAHAEIERLTGAIMEVLHSSKYSLTPHAAETLKNALEGR